MREEYVLKRVTQFLKERNWTLYRLAKEGEISYSTLSNSFQRNNVPSVSTLLRICEGFGITMAEFFDESGTMPKQLTVSDQQLITDFHRLPRNDKNLVSAYMQGLLKVASALEEEEQTEGQEEPQSQEGEQTKEQSEGQEELQSLEEEQPKGQEELQSLEEEQSEGQGEPQSQEGEQTKEQSEGQQESHEQAEE